VSPKRFSRTKLPGVCIITDPDRSQRGSRLSKRFPVALSCQLPIHRYRDFATIFTFPPAEHFDLSTVQ